MPSIVGTSKASLAGSSMKRCHNNLVLSRRIQARGRILDQRLLNLLHRMPAPFLLPLRPARDAHEAHRGRCWGRSSFSLLDCRALDLSDRCEPPIGRRSRAARGAHYRLQIVLRRTGRSERRAVVVPAERSAGGSTSVLVFLPSAGPAAVAAPRIQPSLVRD